MRNSYSDFSTIPLVLTTAPIRITQKIARSLSKEAKEFPGLKKVNSKTIESLSFKYSCDGLAIQGFMLKPKGNKRRPCIIYNRGGSLDFGVWTEERLFKRLGVWAARGYIVITTQYRGNKQSEGKDEFGGRDLKDVESLYKILRRYKSADISRIGVIGHSRGGMMTFLMLAKCRWIRAAAVIAGGTDLERMAKIRPEMKGIFKSCFGATKSGIRLRSAVKICSKFSRRTPLLLLHGTADWRVSVQDSLDLAKKLVQFKIPHRLICFEGADHILTEVRSEADQQIQTWFERFVLLKGKLPRMTPHGP